MTQKRLFAFVRQLEKGSGANLKTVADIRSAERHAKREDKTSVLRQREGASHVDNHFWSRCGDALDTGGADYFAAFKAHKAKHGVTSERRGAALASHALVGVSPEWLEATGSPHDLNNPRVQLLIERAKDWVESWCGEGAVWAVRYDTDEIGSGIVDVIASPIRTAHHKSGSNKPSISVNKANTDLVDAVNARRLELWVEAGQNADDYIPIRKSYRAMQDSWAWFAQEHLSPALERGDPKEKTRREHLYPEEFKEALAAAKSAEEFEAKAKDMADQLVRMQHDAEMAAAKATAQRVDDDQKAAAARREQKDADIAARASREEEGKLQERILSAREEILDLEQKREEHKQLETAISVAKARLASLRSQSEDILQAAKTEAAAILAGAKSKAAEIAAEVLNAWPEFKTVPQPFKQAMNHYTGLLEVVKDIFTKVDLRASDSYRAQVTSEELVETGDPPPALDLVLERARTRIEAKNNLIKTNEPRGPST